MAGTRRFILAAVMTACSTSLLTGQEADFKVKVLEEWKSILDKITSARWHQRITFHSEKTQMGGARNIDNSTEVIQYVFKRNTGWQMVSEVNSGPESPAAEGDDGGRIRKDAFLVNSHYAADLRGLNKSDAGSWVLTELKQDRKTIDQRRTEDTRCPWMIVGNIPLTLWLRDPAFAVRRIEEVDSQPGLRLSRVHFAYQAPTELSAGLPRHVRLITSGHIDFDPKRGYRPTGYHYRVKGKTHEGSMKGTISYGEDANGVPVVSTMTLESEATDQRKGVLVGKEAHTFLNLEYNGPVRDEELTISHFGLPEVNGAPPRKSGSPWYTWFAVAGVTCLLLSIGFRRAARYYREKRKSHAVPA